jgi:hypothetical protein
MRCNAMQCTAAATARQAQTIVRRVWTEAPDIILGSLPTGQGDNPKQGEEYE